MSNEVSRKSLGKILRPERGSDLPRETQAGCGQQDPTQVGFATASGVTVDKSLPGSVPQVYAL